MLGGNLGSLLYGDVSVMNCTMDDVRCRFLGLPHGTTPAAVTTNKNIKMISFKSSENIQKKEGWPDRCVSDN